MKKLLSFLAFLVLGTSISAQNTDADLKKLSGDLVRLDAERKILGSRIEVLKLTRIREQLEKIGLPALHTGDELITHAAYFLDFSPEYRQARWVAHIITPDVINGIVFRTNDFRVDSSVIAGSAVEQDYFLKKLKPDSSFEYDGFGYDRGHLAPSADFRWSQQALSESYFYSNMSPQLAAFNRGSWGDLEDAVRGYIYRNPSSDLYVVTGPVLRPGLPVIEKSIHKIPIPERFFKVVLDLKNSRGIAFIMPNENITQPLKSFAVSIDEAEKITQLDFFSKLPTTLQTTIESQADPSLWLPTINSSDVEPLAQETLSKNHFNSTLAQQQTRNKEDVYVCGTVVGARTSKAGNILINLDKQFPNQVFTVFIKKEDIVNFNYNPEIVLKGKIICVKGKVLDLGGTASMYIKTQSDLNIQ